MRVRRKSPVIEAARFVGFVDEETDAVAMPWPQAWGTKPRTWRRSALHRKCLLVGRFEAWPGDWIVREPEYGFVVYGPDSFDDEYEPAEGDAP